MQPVEPFYHCGDVAFGNCIIDFLPSVGKLHWKCISEKDANKTEAKIVVMRQKECTERLLQR